ncbi:MFS general substrate transporter [Trichocladium antarcticum]|uniref:MFS general substrate transporter n=1 Tax=Trichocladium antarcticum TaxID=1450529 RepID=A0AAN6UHX4_9PEZI|nr:MFS general substrate transporter [Trichocladium antarcticum]
MSPSTGTDTESAQQKYEADSEGPAPGIISPAPDGGARAWLVVAGSASIFFSCLGFMNSFGVFQEYYTTNQLRGESPDKVAWIGSLMSFLQFAGGAIAGPLFDRYGTWVVRPGAVLYVLGLVMTSLCTRYWQFMLAQGVLTGLAMSMLQVPAFAAVAQCFDKKRAAAMGLVVSGSSIGGIVFPIALSKMLNDSALGFGWSVRIMALVVAPLLAFSCATVAPRLPPRRTNFFILSAFRDVKYVALVFAMFCCMIGMFTPLFFLPSYAVTRGVNPTLASYLLAIVNGASTFGRIIPGLLADKYGRLNTFGLGGIATGIVVLCLNSATSTAGLVVYSIVLGFTSGTIISGVSAAISICTDDPRNLGTYMGMGMAVGSSAALVGPPVNGVLVDKYGGFLQVSIFSGVVCLFGGILVVVTKLTTPQGLFGKV